LQSVQKLAEDDKRTFRSCDWLFGNLNFPQTVQGILGANELERKRNKENKNRENKMK